MHSSKDLHYKKFGATSKITPRIYAKAPTQRSEFYD